MNDSNPVSHSTSILIADALRLFSDGLRIGLNRYPRFRVLDEQPNNGPSAVEAASRLKPDIALIDYWLPDMEGPVITRAIRYHVPECAVFLMSSISSAAQIESAINSGAAGFLPKDLNVAQVAEAIKSALSGEPLIHERKLQELLKQRAETAQEQGELFERLSPRELELLALLNQGRTAREISDRLFLSEKTIRNYISRLLTKTGTDSAAQCVAKARRLGILHG